MRKPGYKGFAALGIAILISFFMAGTALAGLSVKPTVIEKVLNPGDTEEGIYEITNMGEAKIEVTIQVEDWMERLFGKKDALEVGRWLTVEPNAVVLEPGQVAELKYKVTAPAAKDFTNEKVAQVFFTYSENMNLTSRLGVIFYLSPKKTAAMKASITQFLAQPDFKEGKDPSLLSYMTIQNDSNVHIRPRGVVTLLDQSGTPVRELLVDTVPGIYPGKSFTWNHHNDVKDLPYGVYKAKLALDYGYLYEQEAVMEATADLKWKKPEQENKTT